MSRIRGKNTKPELALRAELRKQGMRYRVNNRRVPGTPDISHQGARVAVFVDGCFWHGCPDHYRLPKSRAEYWHAKVRRNQERRNEVRALLTGWDLVEIWECDLKADTAKTAARIVAIVRAKHFGMGPKRRKSNRRDSSGAKQ